MNENVSDLYVVSFPDGTCVVAIIDTEYAGTMFAIRDITCSDDMSDDKISFDIDFLNKVEGVNYEIDEFINLFNAILIDIITQAVEHSENQEANETLDDTLDDKS